MAKLPFQQMDFLPGTEVAGSRTSSLTPPPSMEGVMRSGSQFYQSQMNVAQGVMDLTQSVAKAIMIDRNEEKRKEKIDQNNSKNELANELGEASFNIFKQSRIDPSQNYEQQLLDLVQVRSGEDRPMTEGRSILERYQDMARERGWDEEFVKTYSPFADSVVRQARKGIFVDINSFETKALSDRRELAFNTKLIELKKKIINTDLDLLDKPELAETKIKAIKDSFAAFAEDIVKQTNGFSGPGFQTDDELEDAKQDIINKLENHFLEDGRRWKLKNLQASEDEKTQQGIRIFREAENKMLQRIADEKIIENIQENKDYSKARPDLLNVALNHINENAKKLYPDDEEKQSKYIGDSTIEFQTKYITENNQLNLEAVERVLRYKAEEDQKKELQKQETDQTNLETAQTGLEEELLDIEARYESEQITEAEALNEVQASINKYVDEYDKPEEGDKKQKNINFNKQLKNLLRRTSLDEKRFVRLKEARKAVAQKKQDEIAAEELRQAHLLEQEDNAADIFKKRAISIFEQQRKDRLDVRAFVNALEDLREQVVFEVVGDRVDDPNFDAELATKISETLDDIIVSNEEVITLRQQDEEIDLEVLSAERAFINGRDADPSTGQKGARGLKRIIEDIEARGLNVSRTMIEVYKEIDILEKQIGTGLTSNAAKHRFNISHGYNESKEALVSAMHGRVQDRETEKLVQSIDSQVQDIAVGINRGDFQFAPRSFKDDLNLLTSSQEADPRMAAIASIIERYTGDDGLWTVAEAREKIRMLAKQIDYADAELLVETNPAAAKEALKIVGVPKEDIIFPGLENTDRSRLLLRAEENLKKFTESKRTRLSLQLENYLQWVMTGDERAAKEFGIEAFKENPVGKDRTFFNVFLKEHVGPGKEFTETEGAIMEGQLRYAQAFGDARNGGDKKYGPGISLEEKSLVQLNQILFDFNPLEFLEDSVYKDMPDAQFLESSYRSMQNEIMGILGKRKADSAFFPFGQYRELYPDDKNPFSENRMDFLIKKQLEYGGDVRLFTNDQVDSHNESWTDFNGLKRAGFLKLMKDQSKRPELFGQMFEELAQGTSIKYSDQVYLENQDRSDIVKRIHRTRDYDEATINKAMSDVGMEAADLNAALEADPDLENFMGAFIYHEDRGMGMYHMFRKYVVGGLTTKDVDAGDLKFIVKSAVKDLISRKNHVVSASPFEEEIDGMSILLPKDKIPDFPSQRPGLYQGSPATSISILGSPEITYGDHPQSMDLFTSKDIQLGLKLFIDEELPSILTPYQFAVLMNDENLFFQNSEDGEGLTLYHFASEDGQNPEKVGGVDGTGRGREIKLSFDKLFENILDVRKGFQVEFKPFEVLKDIPPSTVGNVWPGTRVN